jgi:hypothetical protein
VAGQTQVDLKTQSKDVDFSTATTTKPFKSGTVFPSVCAVGEAFFKTDASAGANLYSCTALNTWTLETGAGRVQSAGTALPVEGTLNFTSGGCSDDAANGRTNCSGGGGATQSSALLDLQALRTNTTVLTIGAACSALSPCNIRVGSVVFRLTAPATATISAGTGTAYVFISFTGGLTVGHNLTLACSGCTAQSGITAFPSDSIPLWTWTATGAIWDLTGGTDQRAAYSSTPIHSGTGVIVTPSAGVYTPTLDTAYANTLWAQLAAPNTFNAGAKQSFAPSATTAGARLVCGVIPSALGVGDIGCDTVGTQWIYDAVNVRLFPSVPGSGTTLPAAPINGHVVVWNGGADGMNVSDAGYPAVAARTMSLQAAGCNNATASSSLDLPTSNAPAPTCHGTTYTWGTLDFDHTSAKKASWSLRLPAGWTGNIDVGLDWFTSATTNTNKWTIESACVAEGASDATAPAFNATQTITTTSAGTTNNLTRSAQTSITTTGCSAGNILILRVGRDVTDTNTSIDSLQNVDVTLRITPQA